MASQRAWLEKELERVLQEKQTMAALEKVGGVTVELKFRLAQQ